MYLWSLKSKLIKCLKLRLSINDGKPFVILKSIKLHRYICIFFFGWYIISLKGVIYVENKLRNQNKARAR